MRILGLILMFTVSIWASRTSEIVALVDLPVSNQFVPFSVIAPTDYNSEFVRFVHPVNGKSAVAKVVKKEGDSFKVSSIMAEVIGLGDVAEATLIVEKVY